MSPRFSRSFLPALFLLSACRITPPAGSYSNLPPQGDPYVQLKNGNTVSGDVVLKTPFIGRSRVEVDGKAYKPADVSFFQDGKARYANIGRGTFAPQVVDGNIKLFRSTTLYTTTSYSSGMGSSGFGGGMPRTSTHVRIDDYMLPANGKKLEPFNFTNLRAAIPSRDPASTHLDAYLKQQRTGRIITYAGLGAMVGGALLALNTASRGSGTGAALGGSLFLLSFPTIYTGIIKNGMKRKHLYRALDAYNGEPAAASRRSLRRTAR